ncbi:altered inheritance of mitochondria protein 21-like isoform X1 [Iris pallida]|uniref:Altered inheritance of mitochondria protein 21-like isoform X1 n=1 Tax=Iris pallida TaxID=29817 RepID=A0AAX6ER85_IRIPA|nr:altered inheritance of mitochondria protein 21-like isoform X1 [Iris pallida]
MKKRTSDPLLLVDSSFFSKDFRSEGLCWVKNIYQKFELSCNEYVEACSTYVNTAGEHFKRICDEVYEWENPSGLDEGSASYLSLKHDVLSEVPTKSSVEPENKFAVENSSTCDKVQATVPIAALVSLPSEPCIIQASKRDVCAREESITNEVDASLKHDATGQKVSSKSFTEEFSNENVSIYDELLGTGSASEEDLSRVIFSNVPHDLSNRDACDKDIEESLSTEATSVRESCRKISARITCLTNCSSSLSQDYVLISPSHHGGGSPIDSGTCTSKETISFLSYCGTEQDPQIESGESEAFVQFPEMDISDSKEHNIFSSPDVVNLSREREIFENVQVEGRWNDTEMNEIAMILNRTSKKMSYKKKLRSIFIPKERPPKGYNPVDDDGRHNVVNTESSGLCPKISPTQDCVESEWELL